MGPTVFGPLDSLINRGFIGTVSSTSTPPEVLVFTCPKAMVDRWPTAGLGPAFLMACLAAARAARATRARPRTTARDCPRTAPTPLDLLGPRLRGRRRRLRVLPPKAPRGQLPLDPEALSPAITLFWSTPP